MPLLVIVMATGHRPNKLGNEYNYDGPISAMLYEKTVEFLKKTEATYGITGMAQGYDTIFANACINLKIPFTAAVPFNMQEKTWPEKAQRLYMTLLRKAAKVHVIAPKFSKEAFQKRNIWMVDNSDLVLAVWDSKNNSGTANCIWYARKQKRPIINLMEDL